MEEYLKKWKPCKPFTLKFTMKPNKTKLYNGCYKPTKDINVNPYMINVSRALKIMFKIRSA